mmetsp:Transcript_48522/g.89078  ORF Transcript_48522/g.89078 Transcript_48522/m.89078 type:complete len:243 (+) Transcript_48522:22-750(+)
MGLPSHSMAAETEKPTPVEPPPDVCAPLPPPPAVSDNRTKVLVVAGPVGAGKTSLINALVASRPPAERWAVLVNDVGESNVEQSQDLAVQQLLGACVCCTGSGVPLRTTLVRLLRRPKPVRLIVELSTLGKPADLATVMKRDFEKNAVLESIITVVPGMEAHADIWPASEPYRSQVQEASLLLLMQGSESQVVEFNDGLAKLEPKPHMEDKPVLPLPRPKGGPVQLDDSLLQKLLGTAQAAA